MALSREKILDTAFDVLRQFGLADLSMRRLATELGVAPGALYYHVKNKQELLASLASRMLATVERPSTPASPDTLLITGENTYRQLIPVKECSEVIRLALALHPATLTPDRLTLLDTLETDFEAATGTPQPAQAAEIFMHTCLSLIEQEQTRALLTGGTPPTEPPASYTSALTAIIKGFTA
ncbi:TetR/AcrR family transcriptional regulator [Rothia nasimurium]|uniref:TetR/AcrR family transcriptional regulator n=1 Tax=Rothia nasimurium TaxID=85336 RepID=UPI0023511281|nr:TetR/AcrR family transcriptional regulator [Rothia nasimurium]